ncbi:TlpA disulfide reductase family protein [Variovorax sp. J22R133]|uniref:peroxiredoxin family protein n=1 Tax=Variovorax brevis TaxID=3053503 RepID=UPI002578FE69|nr:TlpA disulfide reductase family protein [Variovorax sp. J22R133]MDM0111346.1 TlpA disulfide reductase family protein [Variovorax sp. J22R133]
MLPPTLRRRGLLLGGAAMAVGASSKADTPNMLVPWRPAQPPRLDAIDFQTEQRRSLADFAGRALVVNFWASWCAPCRVEMPSLNAVLEELAPRGLRLLAINHGEMPERVRQFLGEVPIRGTVLLDRSQSQLRAWGARGLPASFVLDAKGRPRYMAMGEIDWRAAHVTKVLEVVVAG